MRSKLVVVPYQGILARFALKVWRAEDHPRDPHTGRFVGKPGGSSQRRSRNRGARSAGGYVKGRDVTGELDYAALVKARDAWVADLNNDGGDALLGGILAHQGFDGLPTVVGKSEMDRLVAEGHQELWRGIAGLAPGERPRRFGPRKTADEYAEQFRSGQLHPGLGFHGNGTYSTPQRDYAAGYANGSTGSMLRMALHPSATVVDYDDLLNRLERVSKGTDRGQVLLDPGRSAAALGIDAVRIPVPGGVTEVLVLNRTALAVERGG